MKHALIKKNDARVPSLGSAHLDLRDIGKEAQAIIQRAQAEARTIVEKASTHVAAQCELARQAAHRAGHEAGIKLGKSTGHEQALIEAREKFAKDQAQLTQSLGAVLAAFASRREQLYLAAKRDCLVLAINITGRIFRKMKECSEEISQATLDAMEEALPLLSQATAAVIRVHPDDKAAMEQFASKTYAAMSTGGSAKDFQIVADKTIARGGAKVESADCTIDAGIDARLDRIADGVISDWKQRMQVLGLSGSRKERSDVNPD